MMQALQKSIIADTSCLILLDKIDELHLLNKLFGTVVITRELEREFDKEIPDWIIVKEPLDKNYQKILEASLDKGEASAIALALEQKDCLLIMDDLKGRTFATKLGIHFTGTLGILIEAKLSNQIKSVRDILEKIKQTDFRISYELEQQVLQLSRET